MKVLIIKTGFSETFTPETDEHVSLGDVLRTTAILHLFADAEVTWLTSEQAVPLVYGPGNPLVQRVLIYNLSSILQLREERFDTVINLEKHPGLCALTNMIDAWDKLGFRLDKETGCAAAFRQSDEALYVAQSERKKQINQKHWLELLYEMMDEKWNGQGYLLGHSPCKSGSFSPVDVGLNFRVGGKFQDKTWPIRSWWEVNGNFIKSSSWQPEQTTLCDYIDWINSCRLIVSCDSLGLHLAMALRKKVVGLFGPTLAKEIHPYEKGIFIQGETMEQITTEEVCDAIRSLLKQS